MNCVKCGKEHNDYRFRVLQVQTFHVRDFGKNSRVQALGGFEEYHVCRACTEEKYAAAMNVGAAVRKLTLTWGIVMALGLMGHASMWLAVFADSGVAMLCVLNSIRMLYKK